MTVNSDLINEYVRKGVERNIIVHDDTAHVGELTIRLLLLLNYTNCRHGGGRLKMVGINDNDYTMRYDEILRFEVCTIPMADYIELKRVYFEELGGVLPNGDTDLVIGVDEEGNVILGSY